MASKDAPSAVMVLLEVGTENVLAFVKMDPTAVPDVLETLATARAALRDSSNDPDPVSRIVAVESPATDVRALPGGKVAMALRHPGLGWTSWVLHRDEALALAGAIKREAMAIYAPSQQPRTQPGFSTDNLRETSGEG
jgi:hypothetical protein